MLLHRAVQHFKDYLKRKKFYLTRQRKAIAEMFLAKKGHICTDELYYTLRKKYPHIGYATVHRTLKLLKKAQMASEVDFTGKRKRFEYAFERAHHDHFVCVKCGKVTEFFDPDLEKKQEMLCKKYKFRSQRHQMQIFGVCRICQGKGD